MWLFLILMSLLALALGFAAAFNGSTRALCQSVGDRDPIRSFHLAAGPPLLRRTIDAIRCSFLLGIGYGFWGYGFFSGIGIACSFWGALKMTELALLPRMRSAFQLRLLLRSLQASQAHFARGGEWARAGALEMAIRKVRLELHALQLADFASKVPSYDGNLKHLQVSGAKADNYHAGVGTRHRE